MKVGVALGVMVGSATCYTECFLAYAYIYIYLYIFFDIVYDMCKSNTIYTQHTHSANCQPLKFGELCITDRAKATFKQLFHSSTDIST